MRPASENRPLASRGSDPTLRTPTLRPRSASRDRYGILAYVFRQGDGLLVNKEIIRRGYGHAYTKYPFDAARMEEFKAAEQEAREHKRGLWEPRP